MDVATTNTAKIDLHSYDTNTSVDYEGRIVCTGGVASTVGKGVMCYVATTDLIPSLNNTALTGSATLNGQVLLAQGKTFTPTYNSVGRFAEMDCSLANFASLVFHSNDANTTAVNYDTTIYGSGVTTGSIG